MSKVNNLEQKSNFSPTVSNLKTEPESAVSLKIEKLQGRQQRVFAKIHIPYSLEQVWQVLTKYEAFAEFMPSLIQSKRVNYPNGDVRLEEVRTNDFMGMSFSARSVFDIEEKFPQEVHYQLIEGDMKEFSGYWRLEPKSSSESKAEIDLIFDFLVLPKQILPMALVNHMLNQNIPANLLAIRQRVEEIFG